MSNLSDAEVEAIGTAVACAKAGIGFQIDAQRKAERATCDGLVRSGRLTAIEGVDGGYVLSEEFALAMGIAAARRAEAARSN